MVDISSLGGVAQVATLQKTAPQEGTTAPLTSVTQPAVSTPIPDTSTSNVTTSTVDTLKSTQVTQTNDAKQASLDAVKAAADTGNHILQDANRNVEFQVDQSTKRVVIKIVDSKTGELVRQIPTVEMLDFIKHMQELDGKAGAILQGKA